jgi:hypothetical protein
MFFRVGDNQTPQHYQLTGKVIVFLYFNPNFYVGGGR